MHSAYKFLIKAVSENAIPTLKTILWRRIIIENYLKLKKPICMILIYKFLMSGTVTIMARKKKLKHQTHYLICRHFSKIFVMIK